MQKHGFRLVLLALAALPAFSSQITFVCDTVDANAISTGVCTALQSTIAGQYASVFSNANATIYIQYGNIGSNVGQNVQFYNTVDYSTYYARLLATKSGIPDDMAVNSLGGGTTNPVVSGDGVALTSALDNALGISGAIGICTKATNASCNTSSPSCVIGTANCYNDIITLSSTINNANGFYYDTGAYTNGQYDFFSTVEHELDEALGTSSCLANGSLAVSSGCDNVPLHSTFTEGVSAADLFRYSAAGTRSFLGTGGNQANGTLAYFSINGGVTNLASYNNSPNGADYGDLASTCLRVQDAFGCNTKSNFNITNDGGAEIATLDAVGYNLTTPGRYLSETATPEPGTTGMFAAGLVIAGILRRRSGSRRTRAGCRG